MKTYVLWVNGCAVVRADDCVCVTTIHVLWAGADVRDESCNWASAQNRIFRCTRSNGLFRMLPNASNARAHYAYTDISDIYIYAGGRRMLIQFHDAAQYEAQDISASVEVIRDFVNAVQQFCPASHLIRVHTA